MTVVPKLAQAMAGVLAFVLALAPPARAERKASPKTRAGAPTQSPKSGAAVPTPPTALEATRWQVTSYRNRGGEMVAPIEGSRSTAAFKEGRVTGFAGCNSFTAGYTLDDGYLTISPAATTRKVCPEEGIMDQEAAYLAALPQAAAFRVGDGAMTLGDVRGTPLLVFQPEKPAELAGTSWRMTFYNNGKQGFVSALQDIGVTAAFGGDGKVTGSAGCNDYHGKYTVQGDTLRVGPLVATRKQCPGDPMAQERAYLAALRAATHFAIEGDRLLLTGAGGVRIVSYVAQPAH